MKQIFFVLLLVSCIMHAWGKDDSKLQEGNLALPTSQQPGPLFCLGQNILDKGDILGLSFFDKIKGNKTSLTELVPFIFYGINNDFSVIAGMATALRFKLFDFRSSGVENFVVQFEYAFYSKVAEYYQNQATIVLNGTAPIGSLRKFPELRYGIPGFLIGLTASHMRKDWYFFVSTGAQLITHRNPRAFGFSYLYQWGMGRNLYYQSKKKIVTLLLECFGVYNRQKLANNSTGNSSNTFYIGPVLWFSTQKFILEIGIAAPVTQKPTSFLNTNYYFALEMAWKFNS